MPIEVEDWIELPDGGNLLADADRDEGLDRLRAAIHRGANLAERGGLLEDDGVDTRSLQGIGGSQPSQAAANT